MDPRITDILRYSAIFVVILVGSLFVHKHYRRHVAKKEMQQSPPPLHHLKYPPQLPRWNLMMGSY